MTYKPTKLEEAIEDNERVENAFELLGVKTRELEAAALQGPDPSRSKNVGSKYLFGEYIFRTAAQKQFVPLTKESLMAIGIQSDTHVDDVIRLLSEKMEEIPEEERAPAQKLLEILSR